MITSDLIQCLSSTLAPDPNTRISAELRLSELLKSPESGLGLSEIILATDVDMSLRQISSCFYSESYQYLDDLAKHSASIILRKYVKEHWSPYFNTFRGNAPSVAIKEQIRQKVFQGLSDPQRKIRTSCAHAISEIASCDWPDEYPSLLSSLLSLLSSGSPDSVHGAMRVFTEFVRNDLAEDQLLPVMRELVPVLLNVLGDSQHTTFTRAGTISVFRQCVTALYMVKDQHPTSVQEATASIIPVWLEAFKVLLNLDITTEVGGRNWDALTIRKEVFKTLDMLNTSFPKSVKPYTFAFLTSAVSHLQSLAPFFSQYCLSPSPSPIPTSSEDDSVIDLTHLICPIFDFVGSSVKGGSARDWLNGDNLSNLVSAVTWWVQITKEDEESWASNANAFIAQEYDDSQQYSVRVAGFDLLLVVIDRSPAAVTATLQANIDRIVAEARPKREVGDSNWWRPLEAALAVIGSQSESVLTCIEDELDSGRAQPINIQYLLSDVVPSFLALNECPFLQGRGFVFASQFARLLPAQMAGSYLDAAIQVLENEGAGIPIKVSAVKAIHNFCQNLNHSTLTPLGPRIAKALGPFLLLTSEDSLSLVLEALSVVTEIDGDWMTPELANDLVGAVLDVWTKNIKDPIFISLIGNILETLASCPAAGIYEIVVKRALPPLCQALDTAKLDESWIVSSALELLSGIVEGADAERGLGTGFFAALAPQLFKCLTTAEDRDVLQNGVACLTLVIRKDCQQVLSWSDPSGGQSGLTGILALVAKLLQNEDESGGLFVGDLIIHLMRRAGEAVLPVLPELLQAMLMRMRTAKTATFIQSLVIPFTLLIHNQRDTILNMLESSNVDGCPGLHVFIQTLCENAETFQGFWPSRVSTLSICSLFASERHSLQNLTVKGDIIVKSENTNVIMTRSRTKKSTPKHFAPYEFTSIPFPVKALKMLLHEIQSGGEAAAINAYGAEQNLAELDSDDGDEEWTEEEKLNQGFKQEEFAMLSEMLGPRGMAFDNDDVLEDADDEDLKNDPISQMDMQAHLISFFKECATRNTNNFSSIVDQLTPEETLVIHRVVT